MEKWKIGVIAGLFALLLGYGAFQSRPPAPETPPTPNAAPTAGAPSKQPSFIGQSLPSWDFPLASWMNTTKPLSIADLKGSAALVEVFRIECSHCQDAAPVMAQIHKKYAPRGLKVISIQAPGVAPTENNWPGVQAVVRQWGWKHPVAFDAGSKFYKTQLKGQSYPSLYVLDKSGKVVYHHTGEDAAKTQAMLAAIEKAVR